MTNGIREWPCNPTFNEFFSEYTRLPSRAREIVEPTTGALVRYSVSQNQWDERCPRIRKIRAAATLDGVREPACWLRFDLFDGGRRYVDSEDLYYACDALSSSLERVASELIETCEGDIGDVLCLGPILHFERLEVRQSLRGKGLGIKVAKCMLNELTFRFRPTMLILCPFPLQFEGCAPPPDAGEHERKRYENALENNRRKLERLYKREFKVSRLGTNSDYWGAGLGGCRMMHGCNGWVVW
jgi:hypothetical protein